MRIAIDQAGGAAGEDQLCLRKSARQFDARGQPLAAAIQPGHAPAGKGADVFGPAQNDDPVDLRPARRGRAGIGVQGWPEAGSPAERRSAPALTGRPAPSVGAPDAPGPMPPPALPRRASSSIQVSTRATIPTVFEAMKNRLSISRRFRCLAGAPFPHDPAALRPSSDCGDAPSRRQDARPRAGRGRHGGCPPDHSGTDPCKTRS